MAMSARVDQDHSVTPEGPVHAPPALPSEQTCRTFAFPMDLPSGFRVLNYRATHGLDGLKLEDPKLEQQSTHAHRDPEDLPVGSPHGGQGISPLDPGDRRTLKLWVSRAAPGRRETWNIDAYNEKISQDQLCGFKKEKPTELHTKVIVPNQIPLLGVDYDLLPTPTGPPEDPRADGEDIVSTAEESGLRMRSSGTGKRTALGARTVDPSYQGEPIDFSRTLTARPFLDRGVDTRFFRRHRRLERDFRLFKV